MHKHLQYCSHELDRFSPVYGTVIDHHVSCMHACMQVSGYSLATDRYLLGFFSDEQRAIDLVSNLGRRSSRQHRCSGDQRRLRWGRGRRTWSGSGILPWARRGCVWTKELRKEWESGVRGLICPSTVLLGSVSAQLTLSCLIFFFSNEGWRNILVIILHRILLERKGKKKKK